MHCCSRSGALLRSGSGRKKCVIGNWAPLVEVSMTLPNLSTATPSNTRAAPDTTADQRSRYQSIQVAGIVAPFVDALSRTHDLDAVWAVGFPFEEMVHPTRPTLKLSTVIRRAEQAGTLEHMRVDS